ncbi:unnamed protein product [Schistosoma mattheei]|uniref:EF-hand domain-containing protein n=2 Tax=Schistosoma mattheei TaxID=31246 RepID=A0AA85C1I2_9TREM|nr:unnamed protein product [Schistosoma mattheei]
MASNKSEKQFMLSENEFNQMAYDNTALMNPQYIDDIDYKSEIQPMNSQQTKSNQFMKNADSDRYSCWSRFTHCIRSAWATRLTEDTMDNRELYIHTTLRELVIYIFFLITLMIVAYGPFNSNTYLLTSSMNTMFLQAQVTNGTDSLSTASSLDVLWSVIQGPIMNNWYSNTWYNTQPFATANNLTLLYQNRLIGVPRLRQLRMSSNSCIIPVYFADDIKECYGQYQEANEDKKPFGLKNGTAWTYTSSDQLGMYSYWGLVSSYGGGGYYEDLSRDQTEAASQLDRLFQNLWLDRGTRVLFIHFTTYNPNMNLFSVVEIVVEVPASGSLVLNSDFRSVKLLRYVTPFDYFVLACECAFLLFIAYYIVEEIMEIKKQGWIYFVSVWNSLDIIIILISIVCAAFNIYRTIIVINLLESILHNPNEFANFQMLSIWQVNFNFAISITVFLAWVKLFKYISFNKTMTQLSSTLGSCAKDLAGFAIMFFIVFFSFAQLGYLAFGTQAKDFSSFITVVYTLFRIILGDFDFNALETANRVFGPIYFIVYVFFVFFVLINMFIAIINETYSSVKSDLEKQPNEFEMKDFLKDRMRSMLEKLKIKKKRIENIQNAMELADFNKDGKLEYTELWKHLKTKGFTDEEIKMVFENFDENKDNILSHTEQLKLKASLEEQKIALVSELAKEERLNLDAKQPGTSQSKMAPTTQIKIDIKQAEFMQLYKRVNRIENGMGQVIGHIEDVLKSLATLEKIKVIRRETMTQFLQTIISTSPQDRGDRLDDIIQAGLDNMTSTVDLQHE